jgi:predicted nuclease of predicted toxin-antitoxin system
MKLLADENIDRSLIDVLRAAGHQVIAVAEMQPGIPDEQVLHEANTEAAMLLTEDKDFGELAFRQFLIHHGVILIRLSGMGGSSKSSILLDLLDKHADELPGTFTVISPGMVRIRKHDSHAPDSA